MIILGITWKTFVEIAILWFVIYHLLLFFAGTRANTALRGMIILLLAFFVFQRLNLTVLDWLLTKVFGISVIAILIIFHPEIRQGLARLGQRHLFGAVLKGEELETIVRQIAVAVESLSRQKFGALIAIEKNDPLVGYVPSGVVIDAKVSVDLIENIFAPNTPLHDGGMIVQQGRIAAAGCLFPLSENQDLSRIFGTRHRAALGLSEETDAVVIVVSEERRDVSLVYRGRLYKDLGSEEIVSRLKELMRRKKEND